jgi:hypothetical protein
MTPFVEAISPAPMRARLEEMCREETATRVLSWLLGPQGFLIWAHCLGIATDAGLRACVSAVPPRELRGITAAADEEEFLWSGFVDLRTVFELQDRFGLQPTGRRLRLLDFACGCGRLSRYLAMHPAVEAYGTERQSRPGRLVPDATAHGADAAQPCRAADGFPLGVL